MDSTITSTSRPLEPEEPEEPPEPPEPMPKGLETSTSSFLCPSRTIVPRFPISDRPERFRLQFFPKVSPEEWNNWSWQLQNCITDINTLSGIISLSPEERTAAEIDRHNLPIRIPPYYASLLDPDNPLHALRKAVVPTRNEWVISAGETEDPLAEDIHSPVPGLVHRYPDRVLFLVTGQCSTFCRYCTRSRMVGKTKDPLKPQSRWLDAISYIRQHSEVRDVLLSGGDPLILTDDALEWLLSRLRPIPHVEIIRIGTKAPAAMPQRITSGLVSMLKKYHPLWMSIHVTHPDEFTPEMATACSRLADAGIPLGSQTVLLKGINDNQVTMKSLMHGLLKFRIKPYYLYQCDPIWGSSHFRTPVSKGLEMIQGLRGHTSGYAVPTYAIDAPGGGGKIPLLPEYVIGHDQNDIILKNYEGRVFRYPDIIA